MPNGPWTAYSGGFQNGMTLAITPKNVVLRDNSLKPLLQCINYVILKIFKIETFWSTLMAKFMLLGVIGMCSINFMQKKNFGGGHAFWLTQNSWNAPGLDLSRHYNCFVPPPPPTMKLFGVFQNNLEHSQTYPPHTKPYQTAPNCTKSYRTIP